MAKICKEKFGNKITQIIVLIWLIKQQQLVLNVCGQPALNTAAATTSRQPKNVPTPATNTQDLKAHSHSRQHSAESMGISNLTTTLAHDLYANNADKHLSPQQQDATSRNVSFTNYLEIFMIEPVTNPHDDKNIPIDGNKFAEKSAPVTSSHQTTENEPVIAQNKSIAYPELSIYAGSHLTQTALKPLKTPATLNRPPCSFNTSQSAFDDRATSFLTKRTHSQETSENTERHTADNFIKNNSLINERDLFVLQQQHKDANRGLFATISKAKDKEKLRQKGATNNRSSRQEEIQNFSKHQQENHAMTDDNEHGLGNEWELKKMFRISKNNGALRTTKVNHNASNIKALNATLATLHETKLLPLPPSNTLNETLKLKENRSSTTTETALDQHQRSALTKFQEPNPKLNYKPETEFMPTLKRDYHKNSEDTFDTTLRPLREREPNASAHNKYSFPTQDNKIVNSSNSTFVRPKRLNAKKEDKLLLPQEEKFFDVLRSQQNNQINSSASAADAQPMTTINKTANGFSSESVQPQTEEGFELNFTEQQKVLTLNATAGYGNNMTTIKSFMNNKQLDGNSSINNHLADNGNHVVSDIGAASAEQTATAAQIAAVASPPTDENALSTTGPEQNLLESKTTLIAPATSSISPLNSWTGSSGNATTTNRPFATTNGILWTHDFAYDKLNPASAETETVAASFQTPSLAQLYSTTPGTLTLTLTPVYRSPSTLSAANSLAVGSNSAGAVAATATSPPSWPVKHASVLEGNVILGGLMMVHSREDSITCGPIMPQGGIQALEAMLYTLDQVNKQQLLPNISLGAHILDDCDKDTYGLEMAVDFIKGSISNIDDAEYHCNKTTVRKVISGVVGAASSVTSIQVANLLRLFRIPQVSFFSTSPELSNKQRFEYFSRTIPSDHYQVKAMVEIVKRMGWSYVSIIYEESNYGIKAFEELEDLLAHHSICIAVKEKLVKDSGVADEIAYDNIVQKLLTKPRARGAIIFGSDQEVREVMRAVRRNNATGAFSWIGSDGWSARNLVSDGNEPEVEGTLSVQPQANPVKGFEEYFLNLTVENNQRNPWFVEFWEDHFQCRYPGSVSTPYNNYNRTCTTTERLSRENTDFEDQLQFVSDAVMAFAYALKDMHRDLCGGQPSLCDAMKPTKGADLLKYLRKVEFQGLSGDNFRFDNNGDGPARYNIIHFKQSKAGQYHWVKVGEYYEGELRLNMSEVQFKLLHPKPPESVCSLPCERGQAKKYVEGESCCWHCFNCSTYQIRHALDETQCIKCELGTLPDASKQFCHTIPEVYLRPESAWAIGAMSFSATGILVTLFIVGVFVKHNDTPIVRASGRELSYILLAGILMCYAVTFALVLKPTNIVCAIQRFSVGFCFTVVYAALLTKTNRIARIFKAGKQSAKRPSFISPKSQLVICSFFIFIQILINGVWMLIAPSHAKHYHPTREDNLLVCDSYIDASYVIAFFYPIVLIVVCTVYAVLTRKIPEAFNESKHIGFTMYTTCVIWLAFVPLYFGTGNHVPLRITSMSVTISLSASVTIACLFSPKLYIILIRPERNVRQSMMPPRYANMHRTANTGPSSMMAAAVVTAATCAQEEKIQKHITPTNTENSLQRKKLCEMATQTIAITSIFTNLDSSTYNQIPYADQYVPNNNSNEVTDKETTHHNGTTIATPTAAAAAAVAATPITRVGVGTEDEIARAVANNNKINQQHHHHRHQHGAGNHMMGTIVPVTAPTTTPTTASTTIMPNRLMMSATVNTLVCATGSPSSATCCSSSSSCSNHLPAATNLHNESTGCIKSSAVLTTSL